jgi:hypothetical protein
MGINADLKLLGNDFTNASTAFFIAYLIAEVPNGQSMHAIQLPSSPYPVPFLIVSTLLPND